MKRLTVLGCFIVFVLIASYTINRFNESIPKTWDEEKVHSAHLPLFDTSIHVKPVSEEYYYRLPERIAYKTCVYARP